MSSLSLLLLVSSGGSNNGAQGWSSDLGSSCVYVGISKTEIESLYRSFTYAHLPTTEVKKVVRAGNYGNDEAGQL